MQKRLMAILIAAVFLMLSVCSALPAMAEKPAYRTPNGYNANDYQKLLAFFETTDENGVKNGEKLFHFYGDAPVYDPEDPQTWGMISTYGGYLYEGVKWENISGQTEDGSPSPVFYCPIRFLD